MPECFALSSGSTWIETAVSGISARSARSSRSQMSCASDTRHVARHDEMELDEGHLAGAARLDVVRLDGAFGIARDQFADAGQVRSPEPPRPSGR